MKLADGSVLVAGGLGARTFRWDPRTDAWSDAGTLDDARTGHALVVLDDGRAAVIGGWNETSGELASIEVFDPNAAVWRRDGMLPGAQQGLAAAVLADGRVLVSGGRVDKPGVSQTFADSFLWEPGGGSPRRGWGATWWRCTSRHAVASQA